jgi:hypothetical protein
VSLGIGCEELPDAIDGSPSISLGIWLERQPSTAMAFPLTIPPSAEEALRATARLPLVNILFPKNTRIPGKRASLLALGEAGSDSPDEII